MMIGPEGSEGEESFDLLVCTPKFLESEQKMPMFGRHVLIVGHYDFSQISKVIEDYCNTLDESDWSGLASKLSRIAHWEFEDYRASTTT